jgi:hypothetical protein
LITGYRHLRGLDVTYEGTPVLLVLVLGEHKIPTSVLGHIVRDGEIVGIMTVCSPHLLLPFWADSSGTCAGRQTS